VDAVHRAGTAVDAPTLVLNAAATGSGKTRANVRLLSALRKDADLRIATALNLRSLTLQVTESDRCTGPVPRPLAPHARDAAGRAGDQVGLQTLELHEHVQGFCTHAVVSLDVGEGDPSVAANHVGGRQWQHPPSIGILHRQIIAPSAIQIGDVGLERLDVK